MTRVTSAVKKTKMLLSYPYAQSYLFSALEYAPALLAGALVGLTDAEADFRPDPARFSLREVVAHLADWDPVFSERLTRMQREDHPTLPGYDEGAWAIEHNYADSDWREQLALFTDRRRALMEQVRAFAPNDWARTGDRPEIGVLSIQDLTMLIPLHDLYHLRQVREWREKYQP